MNLLQIAADEYRYGVIPDDTESPAPVTNTTVFPAAKICAN